MGALISSAARAEPSQRQEPRGASTEGVRFRKKKINKKATAPLLMPDTTKVDTEPVVDVPLQVETPIEIVEPESDPLFHFSFKGFLEARLTAVDVDEKAALFGLAALRPSPRALFLANAQPKVRLRGDKLGASADVTLAGSTYEFQRLALVNELSLDAQWGPVRLLVGRRRVIWGSGIAVNPTDLLNPMKDPLDPNLQRTGALMLPMIDVTVGPFIFSALASPRLKVNDWALPTEVQFEKTVIAARMYALVVETDVNLMYFRDQETKKHHGGFSASRFFGDHLELHAELMLREGGPNFEPPPSVPMCGEAIVVPKRAMTVTALGGARVHFDDEGLLLLEYFYNGNGFDAAKYNQLKDQFGCLAEVFRAASVAPISFAPQTQAMPIEPTFFVRQHHVFLNYQRPRLTRDVFEDVGVAVGALVSPVDWSAILHAELSYNFKGQSSLSVKGMYWAGEKTSEFGAWPGRFLGVVTLRVSM